MSRRIIRPPRGPNRIRKSRDGIAPLREMNLRKVRQLARDGCTDAEIADVLGVDLAQMKNIAHGVLLKARADRRHEVRRLQTKVMRSDKQSAPRMLEWIGKNELGQREPVARHEVAASVADLSDNALRDRLAAIAAARGANGHDRAAGTNGSGAAE